MLEATGFTGAQSETNLAIARVLRARGKQVTHLGVNRLRQSIEDLDGKIIDTGLVVSRIVFL